MTMRLLLALLFVGVVHAQEYPTKTIKIVIPLTPGNIGVTELILLGVLGLGAANMESQILAAALLYRIFTWMLPVPLGIAGGLFVGKQVGIFGSSLLAVRIGLAALPEGVRWGQLYGASILCGIGFTMSLFIAALAFPEEPGLVEQAKLGVLGGSLVSAVLGFAILRLAPGLRRAG